jgi:anti-sigma regulatory factor (Ser/Thr protein kinase)
VNTASPPRLLLDPNTPSASEARRWVADQLADYPSEVVDTATLLVSELVTNSVLHAGTTIELAVERGEGWIRVEVADRNPVLPAAKQYAVDAGTGRGLILVESMAAEWGAKAVPGGKVVWFDVVEPAEVAGAAAGGGPGVSVVAPNLDDWGDLESGPPAPAQPPAQPLVDVYLRSLPLLLLRTTSEQYDTLFREFRLIVEQDPAEGRAVPGQLLALIDELGARFSGFTAGTDEEIQAAVAGGDESMDLAFQLPAEVGPAAARYDELLDEADSYCRAGEVLLTLAPPADALRLRKWLLGEFVRQAAGEAPIAWTDYGIDR